MGSYTVALPTFLWLDDGAYAMQMHGIEIGVGLKRIEQDHFDSRLADIAAGHFGFERDPLGMLRYSVLNFDLDAAAERRLLEAVYGDRHRTWALSPSDRHVAVAIAVCKSFLDRYRSFRRDDTIQGFGVDPLAYVRYLDERESGVVRLYGGSITLPPAGMAEPWLVRFKAEIKSDNEPPAWRLSILDALRITNNGLPGPGLTAALGALETVLNTYFASDWRGTARTTVQEAADELGSPNKRLKTIEDVLRDGDLRQKIGAFAKRHTSDPKWELELNLAIDARNDAVHGGINLPARAALRHIRAIGDFLEEQNPIFLRTPAPGRLRLLDSFREATNVEAPESLVRVLDQFLVPNGLDAILYNDSPTRPKGPAAVEYDRTNVIWLPLYERTLTPERLALQLARMSAAFSLRYQGKIPRARVGGSTVDDRGGGYSEVAWALTRAVWEIAMDRVFAIEGMEDEIARDIDKRVIAARGMFRDPFQEPAWGTVPYYVLHAELARLAAAVSRSRSAKLLAHVAKVAPTIAKRAQHCIELLTSAELNDRGSIRDALICLHDHSPGLWGSVVVVEPETGLLHGNGLTPNPQPIS